MEDQDKWPGVDAAFTFVVPSYQWMLTRFEAVDSRLQALQIVVLTVTTGAPTVAKAISGSLEMRSLCWLGRWYSRSSALLSAWRLDHQEA